MGIFSSKPEQTLEFSNIKYNKPYKLTDFFALMLFILVIFQKTKTKLKNITIYHDQIMYTLHLNHIVLMNLNVIQILQMKKIHY